MYGLTEKVNTFKELAQVAYDAVEENKAEIVTKIFIALTQQTRNVMNNPGFGTPVDTGTLRFNWRASPVVGPYLKEYHKDNSYGYPEIPDMKKYKGRFGKGWNHFYVYNNSPYVSAVNDSDKWLNFVDETITKALGDA